jgi:bifunctional non-homologous end joining protein LigD
MINPMLAEEVPISKLWKYKGKYVAERKWNGTRGFVDKDKTYNRRHIDYTLRIPEVREITKVKQDIILDGEFVVLENDRENFTKCESRCATHRPTKEDLEEKPITFIAFDLLKYGNDSLIMESYDTRRFLLEKLFDDYSFDHIKLIDINDNLDEAWDEVERRKLEGLILKRRDSRYFEGSRNYSWVKLKLWKDAKVKIVGYTMGDGNRDDTFGSLVLADDKGKVGTGFNRSDLLKLSDEFTELGKEGEITRIEPFNVKIKYLFKSEKGKYISAVYQGKA